MSEIINNSRMRRSALIIDNKQIKIINDSQLFSMLS
jgi:hypothetical protein